MHRIGAGRYPAHRRSSDARRLPRRLTHFLVRIVLLPALMLLLGDRVWRAPRARGRLPRLDVDTGATGRTA